MKRRRPFPSGPERILAIDPRALGTEYEKSDDATTSEAGAIACIKIFGPLEQRYSWFGASYDTILASFRDALASADVSAVLLHIDSPGGAAAGMSECARAMIEAKKTTKKPVVAFADEQAYSAAYALACVADEIYLPDTGGVGSIGCLCVAADMTEAARKAGINAVVVRSGARKAEGHPLLPLDDATLARFQERVDGLAQVFAELVSESRGVSARKLLSLQGACLYGEDAVKAKLADGIMSFDDVIKGLMSRVSATVPLDNSGTTESELNRGSKDTQERKPMGLTELYAALAAAQAAGDTAKVASLNNQIAAKVAAASSEEESEEEDDSAEDEGSEDDSAEEDDPEEEPEPEEEEEETRRTTTTKTYRKSKKSAEAIAAAVEEVFPGLTAAQVRGRLMALKDGQGRVEKLERQVKAVKTQQRNEEARKLVAQGIKSGKIPPSQRAYWLTQASKKDGIASLQEYLKTAVPVVSTADTVGLVPGTNVPGPGGLTAEEQEICTRTGVSPEDFLKTKARMPAAANYSGPTSTGFTISRPMVSIPRS